MQRESFSDVLYATVVIVALLVYGASAYTAIVASSICYLTIATVRAVTGSQTVRDIMTHRAEQVTMRRYHVLQAGTAQIVAAPLQMAHSLPVDSAQTPAPTYVPAVDPRTRVAAAEWVWALYGDDNRPRPDRVLGPHTKRPGQVNYQKPRPEVLALLVDLGMVREADGGMLVYSADLYPTAHEAINRVQGRSRPEV